MGSPIRSAEVELILSGEGDPILAADYPAAPPSPPPVILMAGLFSSRWEGISDVLIAEGIRWSRGIFGGGPTDRVARPGSLTFTLDNKASNTASKAGLYSPAHANAKAGWGIGTPIRLYVNANTGAADEISYVFGGKVKTIFPEAGQYGKGHCVVECTDYMDDLSEMTAVDLALVTDATADECIQDLLDLMPAEPDSKDLMTGSDVYPFAFDDLAGEVSLISIAQAICQCEEGYLYIKNDFANPETMVFDNRANRIGRTSIETFTDADIVRDPSAFSSPTSKAGNVNVVEAVAYPREIDAPGTTSVLVELQGEVAVEPYAAGPPATGEITLYVDYTDPLNSTEYVGGTGMVTPVEGTDYAIYDDSHALIPTGTYGDLTLTPTFYGSKVSLYFKNVGSNVVYVRGIADAGMQVRGRALYRYSPVTRKAEDATGIAANGRIYLDSPIDMPYQPDPNVAMGIAQHLAHYYGADTYNCQRVHLLTRKPAVLARVMALEIGSAITVSETLTGISSTVFINAIEGEIGPGNVVDIWLTLARSDVTEYFTLNDATKGELGSAYVLGYA